MRMRANQDWMHSCWVV